MLHGIIEWVKSWAEGLIGQIGYLGVGLLMFFDAMNVPIPSEAVMPTGGLLAAQGKMNFHLVAISGAVGTVLGSMASYGLGAWLGRDFLLKYGRWFFMRPKEIEHSEKWFAKHGLHATLWGRFIPIVRTFLSLPAGLYRVHFGIFVIYAILGATPWSYLWTWLGFKLGQNWGVVERNMQVVDLVVVGGLLLLIGKFLYSRFRPSADNA